MYLTTFFIGSVTYISLYFVFSTMNITLKNEKINSFTKQFNRYPLKRQLYISSNIIKSIFLFGLAVNYLYLLYKNNTLFLDWNIEEVALKKSVILYMIPDLWSMLITNSTIMMTTVFHHICVTIATIFITYSDINKPGIHIAFIFYGLLSSYTFLVNAFLGGRFLRKFTSNEIKFITNNYLLVCFFNWSWQIYYLFTVNCLIWYKLILVILLGFWINDDIILIKFLQKYKYIQLN
jgi:hypothetical protein